MPDPVERTFPARRLGADLAAGISVGLAAAAAVLLDERRFLLVALGAAVLVLLVWWSFGRVSRWFFSFAAASLCLPSLALPGGGWVHPAMLAALIGLWSGLPQAGAWRFRNDAFTASSALFVLVLLLSVPMAMLYAGPEVAAGSLARVLLFGVGIYVFFYIVCGPGQEEPVDELRWVRRLYALGVVSAAIACVGFYFQFTPEGPSGEQFVWLRDGVYRRAQGVLYDAGMLGNLCAFFLLFVALAWLRPHVGRRVLSRKSLMAGGAVLSAALLFSFSRSSLLNLLAGLAALLILERAKIRLARWVTVLPAVAAGGLVLAWVLFPAFVESYFDRLWLTSTSLFSAPETLLSGRLQSWQELLAFLSAQPWHGLLGIGFKTLPYSESVGRPIIADNMYLSILVETGLVGFISMIFFLASLLGLAHRALRSGDETASFLGAWAFCFWVGQLFQMMSVDVLTYWRVLPLYFAVLALAVRAAGRARGRSPAV